METVTEIKAQIKKLTDHLKLVTDIEQRNKAFKKLSPSKKRVAITKDVLKQLSLKRIVAKHMMYLDVKTSVPVAAADLNKDLSLFLPQVKSCDACAVGSLFMCAVNQADDCKLDKDAGLDSFGADQNLQKLDIGDRAHAYLKRFFSERQLISIEDHFEQTKQSPLVDDWGFSSTITKHPTIYRIPGSADARMKAIMNNIIKHNGTFVASDFKRNGTISTD